jgi:NTE family protein
MDAATDGVRLVPRRARVAVALGGGGARGYAHIGVLETLEERGYEIVSIAGTSMGAVIGGLYAADGLDPYSEWVRGLTQRNVLRMFDLSPRAPGAIRAEKIFAAVSEILGDARIEDLRVPFTAVATDLVAGEERWFQAGPVDAAIRASAALPGFMTPVVIQGRLLADGGLMNPLPIAPTLPARADLTVAVAVSGQSRPPAQAPAPVARSWGGDRGEVLRRTATQVLDSDVVRSVATRLAALRGSSPDSATGEVVDALTESVFEALPAGLRLVDVMELSLEAVRTTVMRHTLAEHPPDVLITIPRSSCRTLDFHKAEVMIDLGRRLAVEALDRDQDGPATSAVGGGPHLSAS